MLQVVHAAVLTVHQGQRPPVDKSICHRCREAKSLYMLRGMSFCRDCFENLVHSRVSRRLNKPLVDPDNKASNARPNLQSGNVLIAVSGGAGSTLLLDLLDSRGYYGHEDNETRDITKGQKNIVWARGWAVHVDFSSVTGLESHAEALGALAADHGLQFAVIKAEEAFDPALRTRLRQATGGAASATAAPSAMGVDLSAPGTLEPVFQVLIPRPPAHFRPLVVDGHPTRVVPGSPGGSPCSVPTGTPCEHSQCPPRSGGVRAAQHQPHGSGRDDHA